MRTENEKRTDNREEKSIDMYERTIWSRIGNERKGRNALYRRIFEEKRREEYRRTEVSKKRRGVKKQRGTALKG